METPMFTEMSNVQKNILDGTWLSSIGLGWLVQIDWVFVFGAVMGVLTLAVRIWERRNKNKDRDEEKRSNDIRERELHLKELEYHQREIESGRRKNVDPQ